MRNSRDDGRDPFNQNFRKFRSKTQWIGSVQPEKFRKNVLFSRSEKRPLFPVGPVGILVEWIAPRVSCTQHLEVTRLPKAEVRKFEWSLYNIDAYVCNLEKKLKWNELLCSPEIVNRHFESKECFSAASWKVLCEFLTEAKISVMCDFRSTLGVSLLWKHSCAFLLMVLFLRSIITDW